MTEYWVKTTIAISVEANSEKEADKKATAVFDNLNFRINGIEIDTENEYDIECHGIEYEE